MRFDIDWDDDDLLREIRRARTAVGGSSLARFMRTQGNEVLQKRATARFDNDGDRAAMPNSGKWLRLRPATNLIRAALGFPPVTPINHRTGDLRAWMTTNEGITTFDASSSDMIWPGRDPNALTGEKFETAQVGKKTATHRTPPRPVAAANETDLRLMLSGITNWIESLSEISKS